jgi:hypothetical protein
MQPTRLRPFAYWRKPRKHHTTMLPSTAFPLHPSAPKHGFAACECIHLSVISLDFDSQDQASFLRVMMPRHWVTSCRRCEITEGSHLQGHIYFNCYARWFALRWEVGTGYLNCLRNTAYWVVLSDYLKSKNVVVVKYFCCVAEDFVFWYCKQH